MADNLITLTRDSDGAAFTVGVEKIITVVDRGAESTIRYNDGVTATNLAVTESQAAVVALANATAVQLITLTENGTGDVISLNVNAIGSVVTARTTESTVRYLNGGVTSTLQADESQAVVEAAANA